VGPCACLLPDALVVAGVELTLGGDLTCVSGVGASASSCVAIARAVGEALGRTMSEEEVNAAAYEGEKGYHGTPSGIDNTAATYGGVIHFERTADGPSIFRQLTMAEPVEIVFGWRRQGSEGSFPRVVRQPRQEVPGGLPRGERRAGGRRLGHVRRGNGEKSRGVPGALGELRGA